jgi:hypothetical protein
VITLSEKKKRNQKKKAPRALKKAKAKKANNLNIIMSFSSTDLKNMQHAYQMICENLGNSSELINKLEAMNTQIQQDTEKYDHAASVVDPEGDMEIDKDQLDDYLNDRFDISLEALEHLCHSEETGDITRDAREFARHVLEAAYYAAHHRACYDIFERGEDEKMERAGEEYMRRFE